MKSSSALAARFPVALAVLACGCSSIPREYQPIIDSLHTPEMEAAIEAARQPSASALSSTSRRQQPAMNRDETLQRIEHAADETQVISALRDFIADPANGHDARLATLLGNASDVPGIALELTRFRLAARANEIGTEDLEAVFARASVRIAELHDRTGGWKAFKIRSSVDKKKNGAQ